MPHEKIWDMTNTRSEAGFPMPDQNALEIHWSTLDQCGWFEVVVNRPGMDARTPADDAASLEYAAKLLQSEKLFVGGDDVTVKGVPLCDVLTGVQLTMLAEQLAPHLRHAAGEPTNRSSIMLDREGVNRLLRVTKSAAPKAFGRDEW